MAWLWALWTLWTLWAMAATGLRAVGLAPNRQQGLRMSMMADIGNLANQFGLTPRLAAYAAALREEPDDKLRYQKLLLLATECPAMAADLRTDANRVPGCTSIVHVHASQDAETGRVAFYGDSDAVLTRGLVAMLVNGLSGHTCEEIDAVRPEFIQHAGIATSLTPGRNSGFLNMLRLMQAKARDLEQTRAAGGGGSRSSLGLGSPNPNPNPNPNLGLGSADGARATLQAAQGVTGPAVDPRAAEVAVLLSGGVDSSVALQLLREQGHSVRAFYLKACLRTYTRIDLETHAS